MKIELPNVDSQSQNNTSNRSNTRYSRPARYPCSCSNEVLVHRGLFQSLHSDRKAVHSAIHILHSRRSYPKI